MNTKRKRSLILLIVSFCITIIVLCLAADTFNVVDYIGVVGLYTATIALFIINLFVIAAGLCFFLDSIDV